MWKILSAAAGEILAVELERFSRDGVIEVVTMDQMLLLLNHCIVRTGRQALSVRQPSTVWWFMARYLLGLPSADKVVILSGPPCFGCTGC